MNVHKVAIIGISGSGKTMLSRCLSERMKLPVFHMDTIFWKGKWQEVPESEYLKKHAELLQKDAWIIEGYIDVAMVDRLKKADLVIFLDYSGWLCAWRKIKRWVKHRRRSRPELPKEAHEMLTRKNLWHILSRQERVPTLQALEQARPKNVITLHSPGELKRWLKTLPAPHAYVRKSV